MKRALAYPLLWLALFAMWLLLNDSLAPGHLLLGAVIKDVVQSNIAVLTLVLSGRTARSAFVDIQLELTDENGLFILACIVTATPGSAWIEHNSARNIVTIHVLDTPDVEAWAADFKRTFEQRLVEILQ